MISTLFKFCEPMGGRSLFQSLKHKKLITLDYVDNFVDGAAVASVIKKKFQRKQGFFFKK